MIFYVAVDGVVVYVEYADMNRESDVVGWFDRIVVVGVYDDCSRGDRTTWSCYRCWQSAADQSLNYG